MAAESSEPNSGVVIRSPSTRVLLGSSWYTSTSLVGFSRAVVEWRARAGHKSGNRHCTDSHVLSSPTGDRGVEKPRLGEPHAPLGSRPEHARMPPRPHGRGVLRRRTKAANRGVLTPQNARIGRPACNIAAGNGLHQTGLQRRFANGGSTALRVQRGQRGRRGAFRLHPAAVSVTLSEEMLTNILVNILI